MGLDPATHLTSLSTIRGTFILTGNNDSLRWALPRPASHAAVNRVVGGTIGRGEGTRPPNENKSLATYLVTRTRAKLLVASAPHAIAGFTQDHRFCGHFG